MAPRVDMLYFFLIAVAVFFSVLIAALIVFFAVKYRRRSADEQPKAIGVDVRLEILWIVIPFIIAMAMFFWGAVIYLSMAKPPANAIPVYVVGRQWMWKFQHQNGKREINELHVPLGQPVRLIITSEDVIHSLFIPAFRVKMDAVPGRYTSLWFEATRAGSHHLFCAEYCGTQHSQMAGQVIALSPPDYEAWLAQGATGREPLASAGENLYQRLGCTGCHMAGPTAGMTVRAPGLQDLYGKRVQLENGRSVIADEGYLRESVLRPRAKMVAGYQPIMPVFENQVSEEELVQLIAYLKTLRSAEGGTEGSAP